MPERKSNPQTVENGPRGIERKGGYPAGDKPVRKLKPPPASITKKPSDGDAPARGESAGR